ncbi:hypothetical protein ACEG18_09570 [Collinsella aerofaciens]|uniref:hypothetical protein n=1 Tax=Collinsella aerofaciens TaxID=74426 RepID=UPI00355B59A4
MNETMVARLIRLGTRLFSSKQQIRFILLPGRICDSKKSASPKTGKAPKVEMHPQAVELG